MITNNKGSFGQMHSVLTVKNSPNDLITYVLPLLKNKNTHSNLVINQAVYLLKKHQISTSQLSWLKNGGRKVSWARFKSITMAWSSTSCLFHFKSQVGIRNLTNMSRLLTRFSKTANSESNAENSMKVLTSYCIYYKAVCFYNNTAAVLKASAFQKHFQRTEKYIHSIHIHQSLYWVHQAGILHLVGPVLPSDMF